MKWWVQSFLADVPTIHVGLRDNSGHVTSLETVNVLAIPRQTKHYWQGYTMVGEGGGGEVWLNLIAYTTNIYLIEISHMIFCFYNLQISKLSGGGRGGGRYGLI